MAENPLGKTTAYISEYTPELLFPILRSEKRDELPLKYRQFSGQDIWNAFELSWLNLKGKPQVAIGEFRFDASSDSIVESKSLKLYLNSFNQTRFKNIKVVEETITKDLSLLIASNVEVSLFTPAEFESFQVSQFEGQLIDDLDITPDAYSYRPELLSCHEDNKEIVAETVEETLISHLLKSNCLITSQPDWASIQIRYQGVAINRQKLLAYLISFRSHNEFHEQCVERIFSDIKRYCQPEKLTVYARYTRRGGLDINPWRSDFESKMANTRLARQ